jgi:endoglucanase
MSTKNRIRYIFLAFLLYSLPIMSQAPFSHGVNLTGWFQTSGPKAIQFTKFTKKDIVNIKSLGCDVIRLPINMHAMTSGAPSYTLDPLYFSFLDSAVTWCEQLKIYVILDNHSFDPSGSTTTGIADILVKIWSQMAAHYKNRSDYVLYEVLNEPNGMSTSVWGPIQAQAISAIRVQDTKHTIVVGGSGYNTYTELKNLPVYSDNNLLYTFHFYDPFMFTHQGATWVTPSMSPLAGVPFPYNAATMPSCPASLIGTWIESSLNSYPSQGNAAYMKQLIDNAIDFRTSRNVNIFCGEFGVYINNSVDQDRCQWYSVVRKYLNEKNIPWTIWDYKGGFGLFKKGSPQLFDHDLNTKLLDSLKLNVPPQTSFTIKPDSTGFLIYTDYDAAGIEDESSDAGTIDFYSPDLPEANKYCISWTGFSQYNKIGFDFVPDKDLSKLVANNYALDFMVRGDLSGIKFDVRFTDTKTTEPGDHPWRMHSVIDGSIASWDRKWHHVRIPLSSFTEQGSWDIDTWYTPQGKFDWTKVDNFEISTEYPEIIGKKVWFDNIHISNMDTAIVRENEALGIENHSEYGKLELKVVPNPMHEFTEISVVIQTESTVNVSIYAISGIKIRSFTSQNGNPGKNVFTWDGRTDSGNEAGPGLYLCKISTSAIESTVRIIKF